MNTKIIGFYRPYRRWHCMCEHERGAVPCPRLSLLNQTLRPSPPVRDGSGSGVCVYR